jgi:tRNA dimethylallyltransferase
VILGPTAVGKTEITMQLAERFPCEIVSADSRLLYRGMDIGTAKPSPAERARIPHHLIDVADPDQIWSLAMYQRAANKAISETARRKKLPILVGGTGQYIKAVTQGWIIPGVAPDMHLRAAVENWSLETGAQGLHRRLSTLDREAAAGIEPNNLRRTIRALEVIFSTGTLFSKQRRKSSTPYQKLVLGLQRPRPELYARVDLRIERMFASGFVDEVKGLLDDGYSPELPSMSAIGYRQVISYLQGEISIDEAAEQIKKATRIFVRRQANWFKFDDPSIHWHEVKQHTVDEMGNKIQNWLDSNAE